MNKTAIITGSSRGIGKAIAVKFARNGYNVVINSVNGGDKLDETEALCIESFKSICLSNQVGSGKELSILPGILKLQGDVSDPQFANRLISEAIKRFDRVDVLVNNAGISFVGLIQDTDDAAWQRVINTNLSSVHYCSRAVIPHMINAKSGRIINISSVWGNVGASCEVAYSASKGGINAYTKAAAKELAPSGVSVNAIACGCIDTDMNKCFSEEDLNDLKDEIPFGRMASPDEVADVVFKIAESPSYLTGQIITFDGGWI